MGDPTTCFYQFVYDENDSYDTKIIQYFIMHGLGLCIKVDSHLSHIFYAWSFSHNTEVIIDIRNNTYFISLNTNATVFYVGSDNSNKNRT